MTICSIHGCQAKNEGVQFFPVPSLQHPIGSPQYKISSEQQRLWLEAIRGKPLAKVKTPYQNKLDELMRISGSVCPKHFKSGKPANVLDVQDIDWLPNQLLHFRALNEDMVAKVRTELLSVQKELPPELQPSPKSKYNLPPISRMVTRRSVKSQRNLEGVEPLAEKVAINETIPKKDVETVFLPAATFDGNDNDTIIEIKDEPSPTTEPKTLALYKCGAQNCGYVFLNMEAVREHVLNMHLKKKPAATKKVTKCGMCSKQFENFKETLEHLNAEHGANIINKQQMKQETVADVKIHDSSALQVGQERIRNLTQKLDAFDWCQCQECDCHYQQFLSHVLKNHSADAMQVEDKAPEKEEELEPTAVEPEDMSDGIIETLDEAPSEAETINDDDYFDNDEINLGPVKDTTEVLSETGSEPVAEVEDNVVTVSEASSPTTLPTIEQPNTQGRVFFKVHKDRKNKKIYTCTACTTNNVFSDYNDVTNHFKKHYMKANDTIKGQITIRPMRRSETGYKAVDVIEYQCCLCDNISNTKEAALKCIETHRANGWVAGSYSSEELTPARDIGIVAKEIEINLDGDDTSFLPPNIDAFTFNCGQCGLRYFSHKEIYDHVKKMHGNNYQVKKVEDVAIQHNLRCIICCLDFELSAYDQAIAHRRSAHKYSVVYNGTNITRYTVELDGNESKVLDENIEYYKKDCIVDYYVCICGRGHSTKDSVDSCFTKHTGVKQYRCNHDNCRTNFVTESSMKDHIARLHDIDPSWQHICDICGVVVHEKNVKKHAASHKSEAKVKREAKVNEKLLPTTDEPQCQVCGKTFTTVSGLRIHIKVVHQKERRYQCEICFKRFLYRVNAEFCKNRHLGKRDFGCNECGRTFFTKKQAQKHRKLHINNRLKRCLHCPFVAKSLKEIDAHFKQCQGRKE